MGWFWGTKKETLEDRYERIKGTIKNETGHGFECDQKTADLACLMDPMIYVGSLMYSLSYLRKLARKEELKNEELILAPGEANTDSPRDLKYRSKLTQTKITAKQIATFVQDNIGRLNDDDEINSDLFVRALMGLSTLEHAYVSDFDDQFEDTNLVFGITVNEDQKRITVVFRGSVPKTNNWGHNFQVQFGKMETPTTVTDLGFPTDKVIYVHTGFKKYLFDNAPPPDGMAYSETTQKYNEIKRAVLNLYENGGCEGYDLYVTGHSLGAALSTLVAFEFAASKKLAKHLNGKAVVNISFASPYVGGAAFNEAFQLLERAGRVKHIRVSNENDLVPVTTLRLGYTHVGVNLHLDPSEENGYKINYRGLKSFWWSWSLSPVTRHTLLDHWERKEAARDHLETKSLDDIYADENITRGFKV